MTTVAVSRSLRMIAADSAVTAGNTRVPSFPKLFRERGYIVGCSGNVSNFTAFQEWLRSGREYRVPAGINALVLYRDGRISWFLDGPAEHFVADDYFAIGSGQSFALGALDLMHDLGLPTDPRAAVRAACRRDTNSQEPVHSLRWKAAK
jgi:ATP-dependent protease HslVU (ClpYQ) peptidase subunit